MERFSLSAMLKNQLITEVTGQTYDQKNMARDERRKSINIQTSLTKQTAEKLFWGRPPRNDFGRVNSFTPSFLRSPRMLTS